MENNVDNENTLKHMKSFDFKTQMKVTVLLEDSDEEESPPPKTVKKEHNGEESLTKICNVADNAKVSDSRLRNLLVTDNQSVKENKTSYYKQFSEFSVFINNKSEHAPNDGSSTSNNYKESGDSMSVKEKNFTDISTNDKSAPKIESDSLEKPNDNYYTNQTGDQGKGNCFSSLLEAVSDHLIKIIEAWFCHVSIQNGISPTDQQRIDNSKKQFLEIKNHFFDLSYSIVEILILPQEKNDDFNTKFLNDTIKRAYLKKGLNISYSLVYGFYFEMIKWAKNKQENLKAFPARMQAANNLLIPNGNNYANLKQHLNKPPWQQNFTDTTGAHKTNNQLAADASKNLTPVTPMRTVTSHESSLRSTVPPQSNYLNAQELYNYEQTERNRAKHVNPSPYLSKNATNNQIGKINQNINMEVLKGNPPSYSSSVSRKRCLGKCCSKQPSPKTNTETEQSCIFTSGPPGRQISINVDQDALNRNQVPTNFHTAYSSFVAARDQNIIKDKNQQPQTQSGSYKRQPHLNEQRVPTSFQQMQFSLDHLGNVANQGSISPALPSMEAPLAVNIIKDKNQQPQRQSRSYKRQPYLNEQRAPTSFQQMQFSLDHLGNVANQGSISPALPSMEAPLAVNIIKDKNQQPQRQSRSYKRQPYLNEQRAPTSFQQMQFSLDQHGNVANQGLISPALPAMEALLAVNIIKDKNQQPQRQNGSYKSQPHLNEQRAPTSLQEMQFSLDQLGNVANQGSIAPALPPMVPTYYTGPAPPPSPYLSAGHWQNQMSTSAQQNFSAKQPAAPAQQLQNDPVVQQNVLLESTRSLSTDSGFTSPLHFTSTEGMNNTCQEEVEEPQSGILITHVTSLNPKASFIEEDQCHVCRKSTSKMCLGCFKIYYCSADCQKSNWSIHRHQCKNT